MTAYGDAVNYDGNEHQGGTHQEWRTREIEALFVGIGAEYPGHHNGSDNGCQADGAGDRALQFPLGILTDPAAHHLLHGRETKAAGGADDYADIYKPIIGREGEDQIGRDPEHQSDLAGAPFADPFDDRSRQTALNQRKQYSVQRDADSDLQDAPVKPFDQPVGPDRNLRLGGELQDEDGGEEAEHQRCLRHLDDAAHRIGTGD